MSLLEENLKKFNWPDKKKSLFSDRKDWWNIARLQITSTSEGFDIYAQSYKDAGDRLVEYTQTDKTSINFLVFPILFLYRHYLELALKQIILAATKYIEKEQGDIFTNHDLSKLWKRTKDLISEIKMDIQCDDIIAVENQILQFYQLDASSQTFRYPIDIKGNIFKNFSNTIKGFLNDL